MRFALGLVLGAACAVAIACGGSRPVMPGAAPSAPEAGPEPASASRLDPRLDPGSDPRSEIDALDREIAAQLARAQVAPPVLAACSGAACAAALSEPFATPSTTDAACRPAPGARCRDVCTLAGSICRDQERICELAKQLPGDDRAPNQCTRARASCQAAHASCCSCVS